MARAYSDKRNEADELNDLDVAWLNKHGYLSDSKWGGITWKRGNHESSIGLRSCLWDDNKFIRVWYTQTDRHNGEKRDFDYNVKLVSTPCNYGGQRSWLVCPLGDCNRSVGTLYKGGDYFGCRHCYNLSYRSRNENRRSSFFPVGRFIEHDRKARELRESLNRQTYAGRPTRKARRVNALEQSSLRCGSLIKEI